MSSGVSSPPSHPPLPPKPSLAPKPQGLALGPPSPKRTEGDLTLGPPSPKRTGGEEAGNADAAASNLPPASPDDANDRSSDGSLGRPTPRPRTTIVTPSNGDVSSVHASSTPTPSPKPKPRVPPKRIMSMQLPDYGQSTEESAPSLVPNGIGCEVKTAAEVSPKPRERPSLPARRRTLGTDELSPKVSPRASPCVSPKRVPVQRSISSSHDHSRVLDGGQEKFESDVQPDSSLSHNGSSSEVIDLKNGPSPPQSPSNGVKEDASPGKQSSGGGAPTSKQKPSISPKKPSLAMLSKRKTVTAASFDQGMDGLTLQQGKKSGPQRPTKLPPKRHSSIDAVNGNSSRSAIIPRSRPPLSKQVPVTASAPANGNKSTVLSNNDHSREEGSKRENSEEIDGIADKNSTLNVCNNVPSLEDSTTVQKVEKVQLRKAPALPRRISKWSPVAPPRRVKSMSEGEPHSDLSAERLKNRDESYGDVVLRNEDGDHSRDLHDENTGKGSLRRDRKTIKSMDHYLDRKHPFRDGKEVNGEVHGKAKPPRPPPPSKSPLLPSHVPPPRPKLPRAMAKTIDIPSPVVEINPILSFASEVQHAATSTGQNPTPSKSHSTASDVDQHSIDSMDSSDWIIVDPPKDEMITTDPIAVSDDNLTADSRLSNESPEIYTPENIEEVIPKDHEHHVEPVVQDHVEQGPPESPSETRDSRPVPPKKPTPGEAVTQLKLKKALPPLPDAEDKTLAISSSSLSKSSTPTSTPEPEKDFPNNNTTSDISGSPPSQGSPVNGRSPHTSPKKGLHHKGRNSSPKRPSCAPPPPPPGASTAGNAPVKGSTTGDSPAKSSAALHPPHMPVKGTKTGDSPAKSSAALHPPHVPTPSPKPTSTPATSTPKPRRTAPPRPNLPPLKPPPRVPTDSHKPVPVPGDENDEDQTNVYTEANSHVEAGEEISDSDGERDHDYELIPDPRKSLQRKAKPPPSSGEDAPRLDSNRASGYIDDDGLYLEPNQTDKVDDDAAADDEDDYNYPEFVPPGAERNIPASPSPPPLPPNPEFDPSPVESPVHSSQRRSSAGHPRRKAPKKPRRSHSIQSNTDISFDSHGSFDATADGHDAGHDAGMEGDHRTPSDRSGSLTDSSGNEDDDDDDSFTDDEDIDDGDYAGVDDGGEDAFNNLELPEGRMRLQSLGRKAQKAFMVAKEIKDSEKVFVDVLKLMNVDLRQVIEKGKGGKPLMDKVALDQILGHLPHLQMFNECLLTDLETRIKNWSTNPKIADIFLTKGHFLKLYSQYILDFERITAALDEACNKTPAFLQVVREFESSERCKNLAVKHYMLKPVQRIPQYKMLLTDYQKQLDPTTIEYEKTKDALAIVSEVANHANESMRQGDNFGKLLAIQHSLIGSQEIVKPGRRFVKEGELQKLSRRVHQLRKFYLLSDILLHTTPLPTGQYKLNNELSLAGMKVNKSNQDDCNEISIISIQRSFTLLATTKEEQESWYNALTTAINDYESKKSSFEVGHGRQEGGNGDTSSLGRKAPLWIPDSRVTMCMICTSEFTITWRRHHCRACGKVTCGNCSRNKAPLAYLADKEARVCDDCYETLVLSQISEEVPEENEGKERTKKSSKTKRRKSKSQPVRPSALKVSAKDVTNSTMSGYLWTRSKKKDWKKMWYRIKDKVLYKYKASEDVVALQSMPLLGYAVCIINEQYEGFESGLILQLTQGPMKVMLRADSVEACDRWNKALVEASCLD